MYFLLHIYMCALRELTALAPIMALLSNYDIFLSAKLTDDKKLSYIFCPF